MSDPKKPADVDSEVGLDGQAVLTIVDADGNTWNSDGSEPPPERLVETIPPGESEDAP